DVKAVGAGVAPFVVRDGEPSLELHAVVGADRVDTPEAVGSGRLQFSIANTLERGVIVRVEDGRWPDTVATAAQVTALQEFRDLFSSEVLAPGLELSVESIAVLFTDLVGSTAMYARTGDAPAFRIVKDHFDAVRSVIARHEGAVVKTIGDAVMAVFVDPENCLEAALELDGSVAQIECDGVPLRLRVGFHAGACIAMRANERIDYFGTTVNLAARLQSLSDAGQVTMARSDAQRPGIASRLAEIGGALATQTLTIKGFAQPIDVVRVSSR
ncbi:MAG TPA: adenylate/guanylate cyclase domain-containing protein, partial [Candidatus Baltobacteraceae bacterium]|nr:adenylate/guanylate cyclase domain-containing protein [Candidatus Baltobacteraceae bacterium]